MRNINPASEIREAAVVKGSAYDPLDAPYLLVVTDCKEELPGGRHNGEALLEAVLGTIYAEVKVSETGEQTVTEKRRPDGYWGVQGAGSHTGQRHCASAKAASVGPEDRPLAASIVRNGNAKRQLPSGFMPLPGFDVSGQGAVTEPGRPHGRPCRTAGGLATGRMIPGNRTSQPRAGYRPSRETDGNMPCDSAARGLPSTSHQDQTYFGLGRTNASSDNFPSRPFCRQCQFSVLRKAGIQAAEARRSEGALKSPSGSTEPVLFQAMPQCQSHPRSTATIINRILVVYRFA